MAEILANIEQTANGREAMVITIPESHARLTPYQFEFQLCPQVTHCVRVNVTQVQAIPGDR
ncbi:MAG: hypothetical protein U0936_11170 [Planctomycetaceae bacterium]